MALRKFLILVAAATLTALVLAAWFLPNHEDFHIENGSWNGLSRLKAFLFQPLASLDDLRASPEGSTLVIIPYLDFTSKELEGIGQYISQGGSIILADDYGYGNRVLAHLGIGARFSGQALLDPLINYRNENLPRIIDLKQDPLTDGTESLVLNHATSLSGINPEDVLAQSSRFSFLDENGNGSRDEGEASGPLPVVARLPIGNSQVVLVADPSIFINGMEALGDNTRFIQNIAATSTLLYIDLSHLDTSELSRTRGWLTAARGVLASPAGTVLLITAIIIAALLPVWRRREASGATAFQKYPSNIPERRRP